MARPKGPVVSREEFFWSRVNKDGPTPSHYPQLGSCWVWTGATIPRKWNYGTMWASGRKIAAHRFSWLLHRGPISGALRVLHRCDNPRCVNPSHLFLGYDRENQDDMWAKDRGARSERHPNTKLTDEQCQEIVTRFAAGGLTYTDLAAAYRVSRGTIHLIVTGQRRMRSVERDARVVARGRVVVVCSFCGVSYERFYLPRAGGLVRCLECRRAYYREYSRARRERERVSG